MIVTQLDAYQPPTARWRQWQRDEPILNGHEFAAVRRTLLDRQVSSDRKDEILAALIRRAQRTRDDDARVATIVCLLPGLRRIAGRFGVILGRHDALAELLASLWSSLEHFDLDRRCDRIAGRLLAGGAQRLASLARQERDWRDRTDRGQDPVRQPAPATEPAGVSGAVTAGVLDAFDAALIEATRLNGLSLADAARLLGVSYEAAKKRRRRAEVAWLAWWSPDQRPVHTMVEPAAA